MIHNLKDPAPPGDEREIGVAKKVAEIIDRVRDFLLGAGVDVRFPRRPMRGGFGMIEWAEGETDKVLSLDTPIGLFAATMEGEGRIVYLGVPDGNMVEVHEIPAPKEQH